ncbi:MAG: cobalamin-binding protein [Xanthomonadaceae bacterium]|nr:cobalamin-binding protein [Xanthomonadaceae bacterium]
MGGAVWLAHYRGFRNLTHQSLLVVLALFSAPLVAAPAARIVTLAPHLAELVDAAGAGERLVGTVAYSDHPSFVAELPRVGDAFRIDLERLVALEPDLVLAWGEGNQAAVAADAERIGLRVVIIRTDRMDDIGANLRVVGRLAGTAEAAGAAADAFERRLETLRARYRRSTPVRVFYQISERPLYTVGGPHSVNDAIALCGGTNIFGSIEVPAPAVALEAVLAAGPEVILSGVYAPPGEEPAALVAWRRWERIPAVRDGHLYRLDASLMGRPTPRMLDEVERMCGYIDRAR